MVLKENVYEFKMTCYSLSSWMRYMFLFRDLMKSHFCLYLCIFLCFSGCPLQNPRCASHKLDNFQKPSNSILHKLYSQWKYYRGSDKYVRESIMTLPLILYSDIFPRNCSHRRSNAFLGMHCEP